MNLKQKRKEKGITQAEMAVKVGMTRSAYTNIETGKRRPSVKLAKKIAAVIDIPWTVFYEENDSQ